MRIKSPLWGSFSLLALLWPLLQAGCATAPQQPQDVKPEAPYVIERSDIQELVQFGDYFGGLSEPQQHAICSSLNVRESQSTKTDASLLLHLAVARSIYDDCTDLELLLVKTGQISPAAMSDRSSIHFLSILRRALLKRQERISSAKLPITKSKRKLSQKSAQGSEDKNTPKKRTDQGISQPSTLMDAAENPSQQPESSPTDLEHARVMKKLEAIRAMEKKIDGS